MHRLSSLLRAALRRVRWNSGRGWAPQDFADRYRSRGEDAWAYGESEAHGERFRRIVAALPTGHRFSHIFEGGCAEGHLSVLLAPLAARLTSCDFCADAVERSARRLAKSAHASAMQADLREGLPVSSADLFVFSDVLYYLSPVEVCRVLADASRAAVPDAWLLFANEWSTHYRGMSDPETILGLIQTTGNWQQVSLERITQDSDRSLTIGLFRHQASTRP
jgi:SAM-dependent methyltransferase